MTYPPSLMVWRLIISGFRSYLLEKPEDTSGCRIKQAQINRKR